MLVFRQGGKIFWEVRKGAQVAWFPLACGSVERAAGPDPGGRKPVERHLVYEKLIGEKGVWIADVDGGHARLLVRDARAGDLSRREVGDLRGLRPEG